MALLTAQPLAFGGTSVTLGAVAATDTITPNLSYQMILVVVNGNASPDSVVITPSGVDAFGRTLATKTVSVTNGTTQYIYLPRQDQLADASTGLITITHSVTSTVTCALITIPFAK